MSDPRRTQIMSARDATTAGAVYPDADAGAVALTTGNGYNISETAGDSVFQAGESALITHVRVDKGTVGTIDIREGASGTGVVGRFASVANADGLLEVPFYVPGGFNVNIVSGTCTFEILYLVVRTKGS